MADQFPQLPAGLTYYELLAIPEDADDSQIRAAFRAMAFKLHPDRNKDPDAAELLKVVTQVYNILIDADKRARYDAILRAQRDIPIAPPTVVVGPVEIDPQHQYGHSVFWPDSTVNTTSTGFTTGSVFRTWSPNKGWFGFHA